MKTIRASEIGTYLYCHRAWWYQKSGLEPQNLGELAAGMQLHEQHGRVLLVAGFLRSLAYAMLLFAFVLAAVYLAVRAF